MQFQVGSPPKPYRLLFDTGSTTSWITGINCTDTSCPNGSGFNRTHYNEADSCTSVNLDSFSNIPYIDGDVVAGWAFQDVFSDEKGSFEWNQTFLAANQSAWRFITADGFLGLGFSSIAENKTTTLVETLLWQDKLKDPRFGLFYGTNLKDAGVQDGVLTIGGSHEATYAEGNVAYVPLRKEDSYQLWRAPLRSVNVLATREPNSTVIVNHGHLPTTTDPKDVYPKSNTTWPTWGIGRAVFDTGAGRISVGSDIIDAVYFNLGWNVSKLLTGQEQFECRHLNASWALSFTFGEAADEANDVTLTVRGDEFVKPGEQCMPPIDNSGSPGFALLGTAFLRRYYSIFNFGGNRVENYRPQVGFAKLKREFDYLYASS